MTTLCRPGPWRVRAIALRGESAAVIFDIRATGGPIDPAVQPAPGGRG